MVYLATAREQSTFESSDLNIEPVEAESNGVGRVFALPFVRFVGAHTGCSCGFPSIAAEQPVEYFDGMFGDTEGREADIESLRALLDIVKEQVAASGSAEIYPVWQGEEELAPKGAITLSIGQLDAQRFFFIERFLYRIVAAPSDGRTAG